MKIKFLFSLAAIFLLIITSLPSTSVHSQKAQKTEPKQNQQVQKKQIANADAP